MSATGRTLPSITLVSCQQPQHGGTVMMISSNLSFPSRYYTQVPWYGPSAPLVVAKRENVRRSKKTKIGHTTHSYRRVTFDPSHDVFHVAFERDIWRRVKDLYSLTKLKLRETFVRMRERIAQNAYLPRPDAASHLATS